MVARTSLVLAFLLALGSAASSQSPGGTVVIANDRFDRVQVEVRLGSSSNCGAHTSTAVRTLLRGQRWAVVSARVICWRREAVPGDAARGWAAWTTAQLAAAQVEL